MLNLISCVTRTHVSQGFANTEYIFKDGVEADVFVKRKPALRFAIPSDLYTTVSHIQFVGVGFKNLKTDTFLVSEIQSKRMELRLNRPSRRSDIDWQRSASWRPWGKAINADYRDYYGLGNKQTRELPTEIPYEDFEVSGTVIGFTHEGVEEFNRRFSLLLIRDYKTAHENIFETIMKACLWIIPESFGPRPPFLGIFTFREDPPEVLYAVQGDKKADFASLRYFGEITIENGEIVFNEIPEKRKVYKNVDDGYEFIDWGSGIGHVKFKRKKVYLNPEIAPYRTIYEWGYKRPE